MALQFTELQQIVGDRNEITLVALECAIFVLGRARNLPPEHQRPMLYLLMELISLEQAQDDVPEGTDCSEHRPPVIPPRSVPHLECPNKEL